MINTANNKNIPHTTDCTQNPDKSDFCIPTKLNRKCSIDTLIHDRNIPEEEPREQRLIQRQLLQGQLQEDGLLRKRNTMEETKKAFEWYCQEYAITNNGVYIDMAQGRDLHMFKCCMNHKFILSKKSVLSSKWCPECTKIIGKVRAYAIENEGEVLSTCWQRFIRFRCKEGHEFEINYKRVFTRWCRECSKNNKKRLKELIKKENERIEEEKLRRQVN